MIADCDFLSGIFICIILELCLTITVKLLQLFSKRRPLTFLTQQPVNCKIQ